MGLSFFFVTAHQSIGQIKFKNDPKFNYFFDSLLLDVGVLHPQFDETQFELRYWIRDLSKINAHQLIIVQKQRSGDWKSKRYQLCFENSRYKIVDVQAGDLPGWNVTWKQLVKHQILNLKSEIVVQDKWKSSTKNYPLIADGKLYAFELITLKNKRQYFYTNPREKLGNYDIDNIELVRINNIITLLNDRLNLNDSDRKICSTSIKE